MSFLKIRLKHQALSDILKKRKANSVKRRLVCDQCKERFASWWEIWSHWKASGHKHPESCRWCSKKTFTLQSHLCKEHRQLGTMCHFCGQMFMFSEDKEKHQLTHDGETYRCYHCGRRRRSAALLRAHVLTHYHEDRYGCTVCEKRFKKKKNMENHLKRVHLLCQYCGIKTENYKELIKHVKDHKDLVCVHCHKTFSQITRLKYHYQIMHSHQDIYKCSKCFQRFPIKAKLLDHVALMHKGKSKFRCKTCDTPFLYKQLYLNHINQVHSKSMPDDSFICRLCGFSATSKMKLKWHLEKTSGIGFQCKKCEVSFGCKGLFDKHMESHAGELVFGCDHCSSRYSSDNSLRHHISVKHPELVMALNSRGFPCLVSGCDKYYASKCSLARHVRQVHSSTLQAKLDKKIKNQQLKMKNKIEEISVYYCNICAKTWYKGESEFRRHLSAHRKKVWHEQCEMCDLVMESPEEAVRHYVEEHLKAEFIA